MDLNLLRVFDALLEERSVTRAGARLGLTQSAVSHALTRLRHQLDDQLFVRRSWGMAPTAKAVEIGPAVHTALAQLQAALLPSTFEPSEAEGRFTIATGVYAGTVLIPPLAAVLAARAPGMDLTVVGPGGSVVEQLDDWRADFVVWVDEPMPPRVVKSPLMRESLVWAVRADHPILGAPVSLESLASVQQVAIAARRPAAEGRNDAAAESSWEGLRPFEEALAQRGLKQRTPVRVADVYSAIAVAAGSDMAALIPRRLGRIIERQGAIRLIEPPHPTPDLNLSVVMLREREAEPAMAWMRDLLSEVGGRA